MLKDSIKFHCPESSKGFQRSKFSLICSRKKKSFSFLNRIVSQKHSLVYFIWFFAHDNVIYTETSLRSGFERVFETASETPERDLFGTDCSWMSSANLCPLPLSFKSLKGFTAIPEVVTLLWVYLWIRDGGSVALEGLLLVDDGLDVEDDGGDGKTGGGCCPDWLPDLSVIYGKRLFIQLSCIILQSILPLECVLSWEETA